MTDLRAGRKIGMAIADRLELYTEVGEKCWLWRGPIMQLGYGLCSVGGGKNVYAHRAAYEQWVGPIDPPELTVDHLCAVRACVRPSHLRLLTRSEHGRIDERRRVTHSGGRGRRSRG